MPFVDPEETQDRVAVAFSAHGTIVGPVKIILQKYCKIAFITYSNRNEMEFAIHNANGR
jgi:hypothetical protein